MLSRRKIILISAFGAVIAVSGARAADAAARAFIAAIYNDKGVTRARIWEKVGKEEVREDSAEADLFKLLIRDLSTGGIIRQNREKDYHGNFLRKPAQRRRTGASSSSSN